MKKLLARSAAVAALIASPAIAADMPVKAPVYKAPPAVAAPSWTGVYVGLGVGFRSTQAGASMTDYTEGGAGFAAFCNAVIGGCVNSEPLNDTAFRLSPYVGFNWQVGPRWVVGVEGDWGFASKTTTLSGLYYPFGLLFTGNAADTFSVKTTWDASARGRLGFLADPAILLYATGGAAWLHIESTSSCSTNPATGGCRAGGLSPAVITDSKTKTGWTVGGGIEAMLWSNWIARGEYRYADFGTISNTDTRNFFGGPAIASYDLRVKSHTATFGLAYLFNGGNGAAESNAAGALAAPLYKAPPAVAGWSWSGLHVGLGIGVRSTQTNATVTGFTQDGVDVLAGTCAFQANRGGCVTSNPLNDTAYRLKPYVGYDWQVGLRWLVGIEGDWGFGKRTTTLNGMFYPTTTAFIFNAADTFSVKTTWDASARGRIGFLVTPSILLYATGGAAWLRVESTSNCDVTIGGFCSPVRYQPPIITDSQTKIGCTIGGGVESMLSSNWLARAEYRYADFGTITSTDTRTRAIGSMVVTYDLAVKTHTALFGLAYKFDWASPVVAKY